MVFALFALFDKWLWAWWLVPKFVQRPVLQGTWHGYLTIWAAWNPAKFHLVDSVLTDITSGVSAFRSDGCYFRLYECPIKGNTLRLLGQILVRSENTATDAVPIQVKNNTVSGIPGTTEPFLRLGLPVAAGADLTGNTGTGSKANNIHFGGTLIQNCAYRKAACGFVA
ncbi:hypothetical protein AU252_00145 [Pseudarthrobacter sulfonivorans]|uniref:Uncharacterized protein n=1 Tax=Pseudarthrobacter sulfonivorans TaxID=121292 RepID=A0A0U3F7D3_9MICC|nr:hypothetical protein [Pseudarthrobacter sulfonivorans]ALV39769.1 hypothetical protein AU252_00145 [Pseudarthrobacter sulfonivorans]